MNHNHNAYAWIGALAAGVLAFAPAEACAAQPAPYPMRPVRLIVPFPAGGSTDFNARVIQDKLSDLLGQQLVIDNRGGASGQIGTRLVKSSDPDGYTLLLHTVAYLTSPLIYKTAGYDPIRDFAIVSLVTKIPTAISVHPSLPVHSVQELLKLAKSGRGQLDYASSGIGTNSHLTGELFNLMGHVNLRAVQYKGGGPALAAVVSSEMRIGFSNITNTARLHEGGLLRALAVCSLMRSSALPSLPTVAESGLPGFEMVAWHVIAAPRGTPAPVIRLLNRQIRAALADPVVLKRLDDGGAQPVPSSPQEALSYMKSEQTKWQRVINERNVKVD